MVDFLNAVTGRQQRFRERRQRATPPDWVIGTEWGRSSRSPAAPVTLPLPQLQKGIYLLGGAGSGKTTALELLTRLLIRHDHGFVAIDPHGDWTRSNVAFLLMESRRAEQEGKPFDFSRIVLVEPFRTDAVIPFNILDGGDTPDHAHVEGLVGIFRRLWAEFGWGARMENYQRHLCLALKQAGLTLVEATAFLTDPVFRDWVLRQVSDEAVRWFWHDRYDQRSTAAQSTLGEPIQTRYDALHADPRIRGMFGQQGNALDFRRLMDEGKWVLINLSRGQLPHSSSLLGSLMIACLENGAMSRADIPEPQRRPFACLVDEFQNFCGDGFERILSEARKYRIWAALAHQCLSQTSKELANACFANVHNRAFFRVSAADAAVIHRELGHDPLAGQDLIHLPVGHAILQRRGEPAVGLRFLPVDRPPVEEEELDQFMAMLRRQHGRPLSIVQAEIDDRLQRLRREPPRPSDTSHAATPLFPPPSKGGASRYEEADDE